MRLLSSSLLLASSLLIVGCQKPDSEAAAVPAPAPVANDPAAPPSISAPVAVATLTATAGNTVAGKIDFTLVDGVLRANGEVSGLTPGSEHGFHIHETGDCSAPDGSSAGGHFNPTTSEHGSVNGAVHHGGDMPNLVADAQGVAKVDGPVSSNVNAGSGDAADIIGRGLIVHAGPDDYATQPTGNAGARLACAVISAP
jgi:Cu-Zn family superoxide dismutase